MNTFTIAYLTFLEARYRKLLWLVAAMGILFLVLFAVGFYFAHRDLRTNEPLAELIKPYTAFLHMGLYVVNFLVMTLAVLASVGVLAGEIDSGTIHTVATKPLRRWEIVVGKWLGLAIMLLLFTMTMSVGILVIVWTVAHYLPPSPVQGIALMGLGGLVLLTLSILFGTRLSMVTNGVLLFMLYAIAFIGGWTGSIGSFTKAKATTATISLIVSLVIPNEAMWQRAAYLMQPAFLRALPFSPFSNALEPKTWLVGYALGYIAVLLLLAVWSFQRRDL